MRLRTIIVDDEFLALQLLETYCKEMGEIHLLHTYAKAKEANQYLLQHTVDLLITDIQMPYLSGIDLVNSLAQKPLVIFTTANPQYAVQAFDMCVIDYLVKPISMERFRQAITKALHQYQLVAANSAFIDGPYITVKVDYKDLKVFHHEIIYIEGWGEYIKIITAKETIITLLSLKRMEEMLPTAGFKRIHKSYIVALNKVKAQNVTELVMANKAVIPLGKFFKT